MGSTTRRNALPAVQVRVHLTTGKPPLPLAQIVLLESTAPVQILPASIVLQGSGVARTLPTTTPNLTVYYVMLGNTCHLLDIRTMLVSTVMPGVGLPKLVLMVAGSAFSAFQASTRPMLG